MKMFRFIKKYWLLILICLGAILLITNQLLKTQPQDVIPTPTTLDVANYRSLLPGTSTQEDVNKLLGLPLNEVKENSKSIAGYKSTNQYRYNTVIFENGKVSIIKEVVTKVDNKKSNFITSQFGLAPYILYNNNSNDPFNLYVYPTNGIAYLGSEDGTLLEIWYFEPTTIDNFISLWGTGYSKEKPQNIPIGY